MKIGFVLDDGLDRPDGVQQYITTLGGWLSAQGHEVRYLVGETHNNQDKKVYVLSRNIRVNFNGNRMSVPLPVPARRIKKILRDEQFDVLHVQLPYSPFMAAKVIKLCSKKTALIGTFHILPYNFWSALGTRLLGLFLKRNLRRFDSIISVSKPAADFARKAFGVDSTVVPNMVTIKDFQPRETQPRKKHSEVSPVKTERDGLRVLFVGRLVKRKGIEELVNAIEFLKVHDELPSEVCVDICGEGPLRSRLEARVKESGLPDIIRFHGFIGEEEKIHLLQQADIAAFPSLSGESFGIVLIEAMAAGSGVVLGGNNPGYRSVLEAVPESIVEPRNIPVFSRELLTFMKDKPKRLELHARQQKHIRQYDTPKVGKRLLTLYITCKSDRSS